MTVIIVNAQSGAMVLARYQPYVFGLSAASIRTVVVRCAQAMAKIV